MIFALAGNQNCGKTTLFNQLTGSNQHVGNFPGVTVDQKSGAVRGQKDCTVVDLPGIYSLSPYSMEELVARKFIIEERPDAIIDIVDATNLERNLYLTMQLLELERPVVLAVSSNDGLAAGARNIGELLVRRNYYFVPFGQDNAEKKPSSLVADFAKLPETVDAALRGEQYQPILLR